MEKQLLDYVEQESKRGVPVPMIKKVLREAGWDNFSIEEAFAAIQSREIPPLPRPQAPENEYAAEINNYPEQPAKKTGRRPSLIVFSLVLVVAMLAIAALWFFNSRVPDPQEGQAADSSSDGVPSAEKPLEDSSDQANATTTVNGGDFGNTETFGTSTTQAAVPPANGGAATSTAVQTTGAAARDSQRMEDFKRLSDAQKSWYDANKVYYTCGLAGGDCKGKPYGYPSQIGTLDKTPQDPSIGAKPVCGKDYVYCGLNNASYPNFFCYYAKLESGGYYTASHAGNFRRSTPPKIFEECSVSN